MVARCCDVITRLVTACSMLTSMGRTVNLWKPATICSMPLPQVVTLAWCTSTGGTSNQRQISSTLKRRVSSSCWSSGLMLSCWYFMSASSTYSRAVLPLAISAKRSCKASRWSGLSTRSIISTPVGLPLLPNILAALVCALAVSSVVARMNSSFDRPVVPLPRPLRCSTLAAAMMARSLSIWYWYTMAPSFSTMGVTWSAGMGHSAVASPAALRSMRA